MEFLGQLLRSFVDLGKTLNLPHSQLPIGDLGMVIALAFTHQSPDMSLKWHDKWKTALWTAELYQF